jgi:peptidoglycan/xylan/chitin deacetylase (PgdA/CDA1 family)
MDYLRRSGFVSACDTVPGKVNADTDLMTINRDGFDHEPMSIFGLRLLGVFDALLPVKKAFFRMRHRGSSAESRTVLRSMPPRDVRKETRLATRTVQSIKKLAFSAVSKSILLQRVPMDSAIFLTFDDGPHPRNTEKILNILATGQIKATFFITGVLANRYPALVRMAVAAGHQVASHGWMHNRASNADFPGIRRDILRTERLLEKMCGIRSRTFRPPYGEVTIPLLMCAFLRRMKIVLWSLDSQDDSLKSPQVILRNCQRIRGGDIVLFHDDNDALVSALPAVIEQIRSRGFRFATFREIGL